LEVGEGIDEGNERPERPDGDVLAREGKFVGGVRKN